jgi:hypothetical protein
LVLPDKKISSGEVMVCSGGESDLVEFAFESEVSAGGLPAAALARLARQSWSFNTRMGLTGRLEFRDGRFFETVEGPCAIVQSLAVRILCDRRHGLIRITAFGPLAARQHHGWELAGFDLREYDLPQIDYSASNVQFLAFGRDRQPLEQSVRTARATV